MFTGFDLKDKVAIVTGASKGIGHAIARAMGQQGATVVVASRKQETVDAVAAAFRTEGVQATGMACHMGDLEQIEGMVSRTLDMFGRLDIVVNNAAINPVFGPIADTDMQAFDKIMQVNVKGPLALSKLAYPIMRKRGEGSIINISSVEGLTPGMGLGLYSVSKASLIHLTKVLAKEWGADGIRVNAICPGLVETKFSEALTSNEKIMKMVMSQQALPLLAQPDDIAGLALYLASPASRFTTGSIFTVDGGLTI